MVLGAAPGHARASRHHRAVLRGERAAGRMPAGAARILAAWIVHLRGVGAPVNDAGAAPYRDRAGSVRDVLALLAPDLSGDGQLIDTVDRALR